MHGSGWVEKEEEQTKWLMFKRSSSFRTGYDINIDAKFFNHTKVDFRLYDVKKYNDSTQFSNWTFKEYGDTDQWDIKDGLWNLMIYKASFKVGEEYPAFTNLRASSELDTKVEGNVTSSFIGIPLEAYDIVTRKLRFDKALDLGQNHDAEILKGPVINVLTNE